MAEDLPIYSDIPLRTGLQFAELERLKGFDTSPSWARADAAIASLEGATGVAAARASLTPSRESLLRMHGLLFPARDGSGRLRVTPLAPLYRGQDCAPPEFIEHSLDNFMEWMAADSFTQIHPVEQSALTMTRLIDLWPFDSGI
jgi:hypothetical protein